MINFKYLSVVCMSLFASLGTCSEDITIKKSITYEDSALTSESGYNAASVSLPNQLLYDFGTGGSPVSAGYTQVTDNTQYGSGSSFGWDNTANISSVSRATGNDLDRDIVYSDQTRTFQTDVPNGMYEVSVCLIDTEFFKDNVRVRAEGNIVVTDYSYAANQIVPQIFQVTVTDGLLDLEFSDIGGVDQNWSLSKVEITPLDFKIFAIQPSCIDGIVQSDGYLQVSKAIGADRVNFSLGSSYTGDTNYANATTIGALPFQFATGQMNPTGSQDYTIRLFGGASNCFTDITVIMTEQDCMLSCDCTEMVYMNEISNGGAVHKYSVNSDGSLNEIGNVWYPGNGTSQMSSPHGLGSDLNGYLYIAERSTGDIRKLNCDGEIFPASEFEIDIGGFNITSIGNTLYTNGNFYQDDPIHAYDLCTGNLLGSICLDGVSNSGSTPSWGFYIDPRTEKIYATDYTGSVWIFDESYVGNGTSNCVPIAFDTGTGPKVSGITTDENENIYIVTRGMPSFVQKYSPTGTLLATSAMDSNDSDGTGFGQAIGIVYSETSGKLYVSSQSATEDCLTSFDTSLTMIEAVVGPSGNGGRAKGVTLKSECCPVNNNVTIDTTFCDISVNETVFLQELIECGGIICEGAWQAEGTNSGITFNSCNNSVTIDDLGACGTFTLESDGASNASQCGAFIVTVNINIGTVPLTAELSSNQTVCAGSMAPAAALNTDASVIRWQMSTTSCTEGFSDISGATTATYNPGILSQTTYFRTIVGNGNDCNSEVCELMSNCITYTILSGPTAVTSATPVTCFNGSDGTATVTAASGTTPYTYLWSNSQTTATATGLVAGNYTVTVTDNNGCEATSSIEVISSSSAEPCFGIGVTRN